MQIGNLRKKVTFQHKVVSGKNSAGEDQFTWVPFSPSIVRSASIKPTAGEEVRESRAISSVVSYSIMVRYDSQVNTIVAESHRIVENDTGKAFAIHAILNHDNRNEWLEFFCSEGAKDKS